MVKGIGHLGLLVRSIDASLAALSKIVEFEPPPVKEFPEMKLKCAVLQLGPVALEMIEETNPQGGIAAMVAERGDLIHHFCLLSDDIEADTKALKERGVPMMDAAPRIGLRGKRIAMTLPDALNGIAVELSEP
jgi:methylmalonyl-CoA/ethylmalonyl-CoA epimerase